MILPMDETLPKSESKAGSLTVVGVRLFYLKPFLHGELGTSYAPESPKGVTKRSGKSRNGK
jgi:hypothetical protein